MPIVTYITIKTGGLNWSPYKIREQRRDIIRYLAQQGAPNCTWEERTVNTDDLKEVKKPAVK